MQNVNFEEERTKLATMSDKELEDYFWELANKITAPLIEMARSYTSPSIERSVLLRMGFSSIEAQEIVKQVSVLGLLGKGAGQIILRLAKETGQEIRQAGLNFASGDLSETALNIFELKHGGDNVGQKY